MNDNDFNNYANIILDKTDINNPSTWFTELYDMENWLEQHIGKHMYDWAYVNTQDNLIIGFKKPEHKTFFLLYYTK